MEPSRESAPAGSQVRSHRRRPGSSKSPQAAGALRQLIGTLVGEPPVRIEFWDGSGVGPADSAARIVVRSPEAIRRMLWAPGELGIARAYVAGELDVDGDVFGALEPFRAGIRPSAALNPTAAAAAAQAARQLGVLGAPPAPPALEARPRGRRHSKSRDADAVRHHYDVGNDFYRLVLGPAMTYSCARFVSPDAGLEQAQASKHDLICRKLGLHEREGTRLLDVGCGWGSLAIHAAEQFGARVVGITISESQATLARRRVDEAGLGERVTIRLQDYRDLGGEEFDAISSVGMFEHVGEARMARYFATLRGLLGPHGRLLNHAISASGGSRPGKRSFVGRYVFPDGELIDVGQVVLAMQAAGFEVRDVESLREHYAMTLRAWVANLEAAWDEAVRLVGPGRARVWRLYMAGSALGFEDGGLGLHQVLGTVPGPGGSSGMPATRDGWSTPL